MLRTSGILLHPTSLPGPCGVGDIGPVAYRFVDFLNAAGQSWWQNLPLTTGAEGVREFPNTTVGWFTADAGKKTTQSKPEVEEERRCVLNYLGTEGREIHWDLIRLAMSSVAQLAVSPLQDILGLGTEYRMNRPGTLKGNWEWRVLPAQVTEKIGERFRDLTAMYDRLRFKS